MAFRGNALTFLKLSTFNGGYTVVAGVSQVTETDFSRGNHTTGSTRLKVLLEYDELWVRHLNR